MSFTAGLAVTFPDPERLVVDFLAGIKASLDPACTVGVGKPSTWTVDSPTHVEVAWDGTPEETYPIVSHPTIRVVVHGKSKTAVKALAQRTRGYLCGAGVPFQVLPLVGVLPARDPANGAELASFTVRLSTRSIPLP